MNTILTDFAQDVKVFRFFSERPIYPPAAPFSFWFGNLFCAGECGLRHANHLKVQSGRRGLQPRLSEKHDDNARLPGSFGPGLLTRFKQACLRRILLDPLVGKRDILFLNVITDVVPPGFQRAQAGCPTATKRIQHDIAFKRIQLNQAVRQLFRKRRGDARCFSPRLQRKSRHFSSIPKNPLCGWSSVCRCVSARTYP